MEKNTNTIKCTTPIKMGAKGYYSLSVVKADGTEVVEKRVEETHNVVTYEGAYVSLFVDGLTSTLYAALGTGSVERVRADTGLGNPVSGRSSGSSASRSGSEVDNGNGSSTLTLTRTLSFSLGSKVGTFSEVGLYTSSTTGTFIAGQLIKDEFGNPTTITLLSDEQLVVTYTLEWTVPNGGLPAQPSVGTGSVTTPSGPSTYEVYTQPYFLLYDINETSSTSRAISSTGDCHFVSSSGQTSRYRGNVSKSFTHDGAGTATLKFTSGTFSPTSFNSTDLKFIEYGNSAFASQSYIDPTTKRTPSDNRANHSNIPFILEFSPALTKASSESLQITAEVIYTF